MTDRVLRIQSALSPRDHLLLQWLRDHGVLSTPQIAHALFPSLDFAQRRLQRLIARELVDRFRPLKQGGGSYPYRYVIDQLGAEVVAAQREQPNPRPGYARDNRRRWTSARILPHRLGVNQFFTDLAGHARTHPDHQLLRWWPETRSSKTGAFTRPGETISAGSVALADRKIKAGLTGEVCGSLTSLCAPSVGVRWIPLPSRGDRVGGPLVPALRPVLPRR